MKKTFVFLTVVCLFISSVSIADIFAEGTANEFTIDFVNISGDAGNLGNWSAGSDYTFSGVNHGDYRMGKFEITNDQWNKFVASVGGTVTGNPSSAYDRDSYWTGTNRPTQNISWFEAAQFVNWLNVGTGHQAAYKFTGTKGTSDYTFTVWDTTDAGYNASNPFRNSNAFYFIPTEDEWVKAAYWNGIRLHRYATKNNSAPNPGVDSNYNGTLDQLWDVGTGSEEVNGTFDMMGNIWEIMESPYFEGEYFPGSGRTERGGNYRSSYDCLRSSYRPYYCSPDQESETFGFRIASVPEPATLSLLAFGGLFLCKRIV